MEVDSEEPPLLAVAPSNTENGKSYGLDSDDDETLRFDGEDDLYSSDLDDVDARWVTKQHHPTTKGDGEESAANNEDNNKSGREDASDDDDDTPVGLPPAAADADVITEGGVRRPQAPRKKKGGRAMGVASDAQLSCPLCFTTVCLECQRHARYQNQFRAVTGINVTVNDDEVLTLDEVSGGGKERATARSKKRARNSGTQSSPANGRGGGKADGGVGEEKFRPVCCSGCDHRVGVLDEEDVFHFFNVIASG